MASACLLRQAGVVARPMPRRPERHDHVRVAPLGAGRRARTAAFAPDGQCARAPGRPPTLASPDAGNRSGPCGGTRAGCAVSRPEPVPTRAPPVPPASGSRRGQTRGAAPDAARDGARDAATAAVQGGAAVAPPAPGGRRGQRWGCAGGGSGRGPGRDGVALQKRPGGTQRGARGACVSACGQGDAGGDASAGGWAVSAGPDAVAAIGPLAAPSATPRGGAAGRRCTADSNGVAQTDVGADAHGAGGAHPAPPRQRRYLLHCVRTEARRGVRDLVWVSRLRATHPPRTGTARPSVACKTAGKSGPMPAPPVGVFRLRAQGPTQTRTAIFVRRPLGGKKVGPCRRWRCP